jgi:hypothetical protein
VQSDEETSMKQQFTAWCLPFHSLPYSLNLKMEATYSSETSVEFHRITRLYFPEDSSSK